MINFSSDRDKEPEEKLFWIHISTGGRYRYKIIIVSVPYPYPWSHYSANDNICQFQFLGTEINKLLRTSIKHRINTLKS